VSYTTAALVAVLGAVVLDLVVLRTRLLRSRDFWTAYGIVLLFQLVTNGVLTGRGVVAYDADAVLGGGSEVGRTPAFLGDGRLVFAPVEDLLFGFSLVLQTLAWWDLWGQRSAPTSRATRRGGDTDTRRSSTR
jgi:lycopene cyclase domain-containing protein